MAIIANKTITYRTVLSLEECLKRLRAKADTSTLFADIRSSMEFIAKIRGNRFWIRSTNGSDVLSYRAKNIYEPVFYGSFRTDANGVHTIIEGHFSFKPLAKIAFLMIGSAVIFFLFLVFSGELILRSQDKLYALFIIIMAMFSCVNIKNAWTSEQRKLLTFIERAFNAHWLDETPCNNLLE